MMGKKLALHQTTCCLGTNEIQKELEQIHYVRIDEKMFHSGRYVNPAEHELGKFINS